MVPKQPIGFRRMVVHMLNLTPEKKEASIVLIGKFNPEMFQPKWFEHNGVISPEDSVLAQSNKDLFVMPELTMFKTSQLSIRIDENRFQVSSIKEPFVLINDFVIKTFENLNSFTVNAFGFNYSAHYRLDSVHLLHQIGDNLAPKYYWDAFLTDDVSGDNRKGGLSTLSMRKEKNNGEGILSMLLQPSQVFTPGIYIANNDHNVLKENENTADVVMNKIQLLFDDAIQEMSKTQINVLKKVLN